MQNQKNRDRDRDGELGFGKAVNGRARLNARPIILGQFSMYLSQPQCASRADFPIFSILEYQRIRSANSSQVLVYGAPPCSGPWRIEDGKENVEKDYLSGFLAELGWGRKARQGI